MKIAAELSTMAERHAQELAKGQLEVNKVEADKKAKEDAALKAIGSARSN